MLTNNEKPQGRYVNILADGKMRLVVPEGTEGAVKREYETSDGKKGSKWELVFTELSGVVKDVGFWEGDYGILIQVTVVDGDEEPVILSISTNGNFGEDLMKKLPNVDMEKPVKLVPYSFPKEDDPTKKVRGITVYQGDKKIEDFYSKFNSKTKKKESRNGYPTPTEEFLAKKGNTKWTKFYAEAREFLIEDITKRLKIEEKKAEAMKPYVPKEGYPENKMGEIDF